MAKKRRIALATLFLFSAAVAGLLWWSARPRRSPPPSTPPVRALTPEATLRAQLLAIYDRRARALLTQDASTLASLYDRGPAAQRARAHEEARIRYLAAWAARRGVRLTASRSELTIRSLRIEGDRASVSLVQSAAFAYVPAGRAGPSHRFGIGTRHRLILVQRGGSWRIREEHYTDPLAEDTLVDSVMPACTGGAVPPLALLAEAVPSRRTAPAYDRTAAVRYADRYCGAAVGCGNGRRYNPRYTDLTDHGGDCTSFVSQALASGGLPQTGGWFWDAATGRGGPAWQEAAPLARFLLTSGYARLLARGRFAELHRPSPDLPGGPIGALRPGDLIGYEEEGRLVHFAIVVGRDPSGRPVVNSHTSDRYHVPWDLGWDEQTLFWLFSLPA